MQPEEKRRTKRQTGISRARIMLKKNVGWFPGYPIDITTNGVLWQSIRWDGTGIEQSWTLTGSELRQAQMTITKLRYHFPKALPEIIDDVDDWLRRMDFVIESLKAVIHGGQEWGPDQILSAELLPRRWVDQFSQSRQQHPRLKPLLDAICFLELTKRNRADVAPVEWIDDRRDVIESLCGAESARNIIPLQLRFFSFHDLGFDRLFETLALAYSDSSIGSCRIEDGFARIQWLQRSITKLISNAEVEPEPNPTSKMLVDKIDHLMLTIHNQKPKRQKALLALLDQLLCQETLREIGDLQSRIDAIERQLNRSYRKLEFGSQKIPANRHQRKALVAKLRDDRDGRDDREVMVQHLVSCLRVLPKLDNAEAEQWIRFLRSTPADHQTLRLSLLSCWTDQLEREDSQYRTTFYRVLAKFESMLRRRGTAEGVLWSWRQFVESSRNYERDWIVDLCDDHAAHHQQIDQSLELFERVVYDDAAKPGPYLRRSLVQFVEASRDLAQASTVVAILAQAEDAYYSTEELQAAFTFGADAQQVAAMITVTQNGDDEALETAAVALASLAQDPSLRSAIANRILAGDHKALTRMANIHQLLTGLGGDLAERRRFKQTSTDWMSIYPAELQLELRTLAQESPRAEAISGEILGKDFPDPRRLQNEVAAISAKLNSLGDEDEPIKPSRLEQRLENLRSRIEHPNTVSPARLLTLASKLRARIEHEAIEWYVETCRNRVGVIIGDRYQMDDVPNEILTPPLDAVLTDILELTQPMKELGLRLVFETLNRSTRRFDGEPANMEFCSEMQRTGVNMDVWLGDSFETTANTASGLPYRLRFTRDVMDFLLMGFHFGTCLAPGDFNFFSTVANAVDVNKRVVYGKTESGKIVGRCLFAMNDAGEILTYHRYAHEAEDKFGEAVDCFADELATAMNSRLANQGTVRSLVAKDWYDDGAIGPSIGDTDYELIRRLIGETQPNSVYQGMKEILSSNEICNRIDELTTMPEIEDQPEVLREFLSCLSREEALTRPQQFVVARAAYSRDLHEVAMESLERIPAKRIIAIARQTRCDYCSCFHGIGSYRDIFDMMIDFNPSIAIRLMRASRNPRASDDLKDDNPTRRRSLAKAHSKLGRAHLAEQLARANS